MKKTFPSIVKIAVVVTFVLGCKTIHSSTVQNTAEESDEQVGELYEKSAIALLDVAIVATSVRDLCKIFDAVTNEGQSFKAQCAGKSIKHACTAAVNSTAQKVKVEIKDEDLQVTHATGVAFGTLRGLVIDCIRAGSQEAVKQAAKEVIVAGTPASVESAKEILTEGIRESALESVIDSSVESTVDVTTEAAVDATAEAVVDASAEAVVDTSVKSSVGAAIDSSVVTTTTAIEGVAAEAIAVSSESAGVEGVTEVAVDAAKETVKKSTKAAVWKRALAYTACRVAGDLVAVMTESYLGSDAVQHDTSACSQFYKIYKDGGSLGSCAKTLGRVCGVAAFSGVVNIDHFLPDYKSTPGKIISQLVSAGVSGGCILGGPVSSKACSAISESAGQIKMAMKTGNNDWARCTGLDKLGACIGAHWGADGVYNKNPIDQKITSFGSPCCHCERVFYRRKGLTDLTAVEIGRDHYATSIHEINSEEDFEGSKCNWLQKDKRVIPTKSDYVYYRYKGCSKVYIKDESGAPSCVDDQGISTITKFDDEADKWINFKEETKTLYHDHDFLKPYL